MVEGDTGTAAAAFTLSLTTASGFDIHLSYATSDGARALRPASASDDYLADAGVVVLPTDETSVRLTISVVGDVNLAPKTHLLSPAHAPETAPESWAR